MEVESQIKRLVQYQKQLTVQLKLDFARTIKYKPAQNAADGGRFHALSANGSDFSDLKETFKICKTHYLI